VGVRKYPDESRIYVDLDGTAADLLRACKERGIKPSEAKHLRGFYESLPVMEGAKEAIETLQAAGRHLFFLSKIPALNPYSATEKILWVNREFASMRDHIILSPDKGAVGKPRDHLIDDMPSWANADNFPGTVLHFGANGLGWPQIVGYFAALSEFRD